MSYFLAKKLVSAIHPGLDVYNSITFIEGGKPKINHFLYPRRYCYTYIVYYYNNNRIFSLIVIHLKSQSG